MQTSEIEAEFAEWWLAWKALPKDALASTHGEFFARVVAAETAVMSCVPASVEALQRQIVVAGVGNVGLHGWHPANKIFRDAVAAVEPEVAEVLNGIS